MSGEKTLLNPRILRAPEFKAGEWLNSERPLTMAGLRGRAVLVAARGSTEEEAIALANATNYGLNSYNKYKQRTQKQQGFNRFDLIFFIRKYKFFKIQIETGFENRTNSA